MPRDGRSSITKRQEVALGTVNMAAIYKAFHRHISPHDYKSVLCLNGELPEASFFEELDLPIIAADGAANHLVSRGITPYAIVGDLDSIDSRGFEGHNLIHMPDQYSCDFQKAMEYMRTQNLLPAITLGISGGYIDHILNNINIFRDSGSIFFAPPVIGYVIESDSPKTLSLPQRTKISLIAAPTATLTTRGLKWDLDNATLSFFGTNSCFNRVNSAEVGIDVHNGSLLALVYLCEENDHGV